MSEETETEETVAPAQKPTTVEWGQIEEIAKQQGWGPEKGDLDALQYLANGREFRDRLFKKIEKVEAESEKAYQIIAQHITSVEKKEQAAERQSIEDQIKEAVDNNDTAKVLELTQKLQTPEPKKQDDDPNIAYIQEWTKENPWYTQDAEMSAEAFGYYHAEIAKNKGIEDPKVILPIVEKRIKGQFPDYFKAKNPNETREAGAEKGGKQKAGKSSGLTMDDLTEDEAAHIKDFVKAGISEEKLLRSVANERARRGH